MARLYRVARAFAGLALAVSPLSAYYHYVHYNASGQAIREKFDLNSLPNQSTVSYFVTNSGPANYLQNDSFSSVLSQVNQALATWNAVGTSAIQLKFGGLFNPSTPLSSTPGGQVEFTQLPPGYYGMGGPTVSTTVAPNAQFVPILRSTVYLSTDLTKRPGPSYSSTFFLTTVHEIGHSLGLQHTYTSSAMSTAATRATSLTRPIDADDIAGLSVLYPANGFSTATGTFSGRVTANGFGVHMASVVAIRDGFGAVSALTNPDGTFEIDGVPPGTYYLYAHPLPSGTTSSCLDICAPLDSNGNPVAPSGPFNTVFLGAGNSVLPTSGTPVLAGQTVTGLNFAVQARSNIPIYDVSIFTYYGSNPVSPGFLNVGGTQGYGGILAGGTGLTASGKVASGLTAQVLGGAATVYAVAPYTDPNGYTYLNIGVEYTLGANVGQRHLVFNQGNYTYVLPSALNLVKNGAPSVSSVSAPNPDGSVSISGTNFLSDSLIYFDGLPAAIISMNWQAGQAVVLPPPGASSQQATVIVYNKDGQNSLFVQGNSPVTYPYPAANSPSFTLSPSSLPAGSEALVTISGTNTSFGQGPTVVGFGSSDVYVRNIFVKDAFTILADVSIPAGAVNTSLEASVIAGFQYAVQPNAFQITAPSPSIPAVIPALQNVQTGQTGAYPGATVSFAGSNLQVGNSVPSVTIGGIAVPILAATANSVTLQLPAVLATGAAILNFNNGTADSSVAVSIDTLPATIMSIRSASSNAFTTSSPASGGNEVDLFLSGFADQTAVALQSQVVINVGGISHQAVAVDPVGSGLFEVRFVLSNLVPTGAQTPITVYLNNRSSYPAALSTSNN